MLDITLSFRTQLRVVLTFFLLLGFFNGLYQVEKRYSGRFLDLPYTRLVTFSASWIGEWILPIPVSQRDDITLGSEHAAVVVRGGCNGLEAIFLMLAGILAFPASWCTRGLALMLYLPLLFGLNVLRVLMLLLVMAKYPAHIDFFHYQIGQGIMVVFIMIFWIHYVRWATS